MDCTGTRPGNWLIDFPFGRFATRSIDEAITVILRKPTPRPNTRGRHSGWSVTRICPRPAAVIGDRVFHFVFHPAFPPAGLGKPTPAASRSAMVVHGALVPRRILNAAMSPGIRGLVQSTRATLPCPAAAAPESMRRAQVSDAPVRSN